MLLCNSQTYLVKLVIVLSLSPNSIWSVYACVPDGAFQFCVDGLVAAVEDKENCNTPSIGLTYLCNDTAPTTFYNSIQSAFLVIQKGAEVDAMLCNIWCVR